MKTIKASVFNNDKTRWVIIPDTIDKRHSGVPDTNCIANNARIHSFFIHWDSNDEGPYIGQEGFFYDLKGRSYEECFRSKDQPFHQAALLTNHQRSWDEVKDLTRAQLQPYLDEILADAETWELLKNEDCYTYDF